MSRDIDEIIKRVRQRVPDAQVSQLQVSHPGVDDDGLWFFKLPIMARDIQIESSTGHCPFLIESHDSNYAETALSVSAAVEKIVAYLTQPS